MFKHVGSRTRLLCDLDMLLDVSVHLVLIDKVRNLIDSPSQRCKEEKMNKYMKNHRIALALNMHSTNAYVVIIINTLQELFHFSGYQSKLKNYSIHASKF